MHAIKNGCQPWLRCDVGGHVGMFRLLLEHVALHIRGQASLEYVQQYYFGNLMEQHIISRFFTFDEEQFSHTSDYDHILRRLLLSGDTPIRTPSVRTSSSSSSNLQADDAQLRSLMRMLVLVDDGSGLLTFATPFQRRCFHRKFFKTRLQQPLPSDINLDQ